jgi:Clp amino terminal domain, pathogenicity island component
VLSSEAIKAAVGVFSGLADGLSGCAVGLAAGLGAEQVRPEHVLLAVAWRPDRLAAQLLRSLGVEVERLPAALAAKGVAVPTVAPPSPPPEVAGAAGGRADRAAQRGHPPAGR